MFYWLKETPDFTETPEREKRRFEICREYHSDCVECRCGYVVNCDDDSEQGACGFYRYGKGMKEMG